MKSEVGHLNKDEVKALVKNVVIFFIPVIITELTLLQAGQTDWHVYLVAFQVWSLGILIDLFRKLNAGSKE